MQQPIDQTGVVDFGRREISVLALCIGLGVVDDAVLDGHALDLRAIDTGDERGVVGVLDLVAPDDGVEQPVE